MFDSSNQGKASKDKHFRWKLLGFRVYSVNNKERRIINFLIVKGKVQIN
jgi:hypothetical protein